MRHTVPSSPEGDDRLPPIAHARRTDPHTSHDAARSLKSEAIRRLRLIVYDTLKERGPMHDTDLVLVLEPTGYSPSGIRTRRSELVTAGKVKDTGARTVLPSGREAIMWAVVEGSEPPGSGEDPSVYVPVGGPPQEPQAPLAAEQSSLFGSDDRAEYD